MIADPEGDFSPSYGLILEQVECLRQSPVAEIAEVGKVLKALAGWILEIEAGVDDLEIRAVGVLPPPSNEEDED